MILILTSLVHMWFSHHKDCGGQLDWGSFIPWYCADLILWAWGGLSFAKTFVLCHSLRNLSSFAMLMTFVSKLSSICVKISLKFSADAFASVLHALFKLHFCMSEVLQYGICLAKISKFDQNKCIYWAKNVKKMMCSDFIVKLICVECFTSLEGAIYFAKCEAIMAPWF